MSYENFTEWFRGITDAEGCFYIRIRKEKSSTKPTFQFLIYLHKDDTPLLIKIKETLNIGRVIKGSHFAGYYVDNFNELLKLFDIFDKTPLNTTKNLNYLAFKRSYEIWNNYLNNKKLSRDIIMEEINIIKNNMNKKRNSYIQHSDHKIVISSYWLLGFIEGDGYFCIHKRNYTHEFGISLVDTELDVLIEIKKFLSQLNNFKLFNYNQNLIRITKESKKRGVNNKLIIKLTILNTDFIKTVFIPLLDSMIWMSKKKEDYSDWKIILYLKSQGKQYLKEGKEIINLILLRMNNKRLSTNLNKIQLPDDLNRRINILINLPSNLERLVNGKIRIISLGICLKPGKSVGILVKNSKGEIVNSFNSIKDCAHYFNMKMTSFCRKLDKGNFILKNGESYIVKRVNKII